MNSFQEPQKQSECCQQIIERSQKFTQSLRASKKSKILTNNRVYFKNFQRSSIINDLVADGQKQMVNENQLQAAIHTFLEIIKDFSQLHQPFANEEKKSFQILNLIEPDSERIHHYARNIYFSLKQIYLYVKENREFKHYLIDIFNASNQQGLFDIFAHNIARFCEFNLENLKDEVSEDLMQEKLQIQVYIVETIKLYSDFGEKFNHRENLHFNIINQFIEKNLITRIQMMIENSLKFLGSININQQQFDSGSLISFQSLFQYSISFLAQISELNQNACIELHKRNVFEIITIIISSRDSDSLLKSIIDHDVSNLTFWFLKSVTTHMKTNNIKSFLENNIIELVCNYHLTSTNNLDKSHVSHNFLLGLQAIVNVAQIQDKLNDFLENSVSIHLTELEEKILQRNTNQIGHFEEGLLEKVSVIIDCYYQNSNYNSDVNEDELFQGHNLLDEDEYDSFRDNILMIAQFYSYILVEADQKFVQLFFENLKGWQVLYKTFRLCFNHHNSQNKKAKLEILSAIYSFFNNKYFDHHEFYNDNISQKGFQNQYYFFECDKFNYMLKKLKQLMVVGDELQTIKDFDCPTSSSQKQMKLYAVKTLTRFLQVILDLNQKHQLIEDLDLYKNFEDSLHVLNQDFEQKKGDYKDVIQFTGMQKLFLQLLSQDCIDEVMNIINQRDEEIDIQQVFINNFQIDQDAYDSLLNDSKVFDLFINIEGILADNCEKSSNRLFCFSLLQGIIAYLFSIKAKYSNNSDFYGNQNDQFMNENFNYQNQQFRFNI